MFSGHPEAERTYLLLMEQVSHANMKVMGGFVIRFLFETCSLMSPGPSGLHAASLEQRTNWKIFFRHHKLGLGLRAESQIK